MTAGDEVARIAQFLAPDSDSYTAADVVRQLLAGVPVNGNTVSNAQNNSALA